MGFLRRWLSETVSIALALGFAILAMQAPSFTHDYASTLLQVAENLRGDIAQREASARQFYGIAATDDQQFVAALKPFEPSNAETLGVSIARARTLRDAYDRIAAAPLLAAPVVAVQDAFDDEHGYKAQIWNTLFGTYGIGLSFGAAPVVYGVVGLLFGSFLAQLLFAACDGARRRIFRRSVSVSRRAGSY